MRIVLLTHYYAPEIGAPQRRWDAFVQRFVAAGHEVTVIAPVPHYPTAHRLPGAPARVFRPVRGRHGETVVRVPFLPVGGSTRARMLDQLVAAVASAVPGLGRRGDVLVATVPGLPTLALGVALSRLTRTPLVAELRDAWPDLIAEAGVAPGRAARLLHRGVTALQRRADLVVTTTYGFADVLRSRGLQRVETVTNGIDVAAVPALPPPPRVRDRLRVLYLGTHGVSQGLETALAAARRLGPERVALTFVGDGTEKPRLQQLAREWAVPARFLDPVSGEAVWQHYAEADTCLVSLRDWPAFRHTVPSKLYELLACGRHVSAVLGGEAAGVVEAAAAGVVVDPEDADQLADVWDRLAADRASLDRGDKPRRWVEENASYDESGERFLRLISALPS